MNIPTYYNPVIKEQICEVLGINHGEVDEITVTEKGVHIVGRMGLDVKIPFAGKDMRNAVKTSPPPWPNTPGVYRPFHNQPLRPMSDASWVETEEVKSKP